MRELVRVRLGEHITVSVEFVPQDVWVGVYWRRRWALLSVWVCLLPCLPIHVERWVARELEEMPF